MPMPKQLSRDAYYSAPPLSASTLRPPRLSRAQEERRVRAPLVIIKREVAESSIESVEFFVDEDDEDLKDVKPVKIEADPRQLRAGVAALAIWPQESGSSSEPATAAPGPSQWAQRTQALCRIPDQSLGPANAPRGRGRPKGSKSRP